MMKKFTTICFFLFLFACSAEPQVTQPETKSDTPTLSENLIKHRKAKGDSASKLDLTHAKKVIAEVKLQADLCKSDALLKKNLKVKDCTIKLFSNFEEGSEYLAIFNTVQAETKNDKQKEQSPEYQEMLQDMNVIVSISTYLYKYLEDNLLVNE